jgi:hypothetical protein
MKPSQSHDLFLSGYVLWVFHRIIPFNENVPADWSVMSYRSDELGLGMA